MAFRTTENRYESEKDVPHSREGTADAKQETRECSPGHANTELMQIEEQTENVNEHDSDANISYSTSQQRTGTHPRSTGLR